MQKLLLILLAFLISSSGLSQKTSETIYYAWINKLDHSSIPKGYLIELKEDYVIHIEKSKYDWNDLTNDQPYRAYPINIIESISIRKSNQAGNGIWKGALWGGGILGLVAVAGNDGFFSSGSAFAIGFIGGMVPGVLIGTAVGAKKNHFYINGDKTSYQKQKEKLEQFLLNQEYYH